MSDAFPATRWTNDEVRMAKREVPVSVWAWACSVSLQTIGDRSLNTEAVVVGHVRCPKDRLRPAAVQAVKALSDGDGAVRSVDWSQCRPLLGVHCRTLSPTRHRTKRQRHMTAGSQLPPDSARCGVGCCLADPLQLHVAALFRRLGLVAPLVTGSSAHRADAELAQTDGSEAAAAPPLSWHSDAGLDSRPLATTET